MSNDNHLYIFKFLLAQALQILAALLIYFFQFINRYSGVLSDLPVTTTLVILFLISILAFVIVILISVHRKPGWTDRHWARFDRWLFDKNNVAPFFLALIFTILFTVTLLVLIMNTPVDESVYGPHFPSFPIIHTLTMRNLPAIALFTSILLGTAFLFILRFRSRIFQEKYWTIKIILPALLGIIILVFTTAHWAILGLQISIFVQNPIWYWEIYYRPFSIWTLIYGFGTFAALGFAAWLTKNRNKTWLALIVIFFTSIWLQIGIGYLDGGGIAAFQERYFSTHHRAYALLASKNYETIHANIINYEDTLATYLFTSTKPPGLMSFYIALERIVNGNPDNNLMPEETRLERLMYFITLLFPTLAAACIFMIFAFTRKFSSNPTDSKALIPAYLYILSPNIVLFSLFVDQAIYPMLFLGGAWLVFSLLQQSSPIPAFILGILLYIFAFYSFTTLPLFPLAGVILFMTWWQNRSKDIFLAKVKSGLAMVVGVVSAYWLFRWILNYDFLIRFATTIEVNRQFDFYRRVGLEPQLLPEPIAVRVQQVLNAMYWNNLDFAASVGVAAFLLFAIHGVRLLFRLIFRKASSTEIMLGSMFITYIILNFAGTAQGEVARLWMFWVPVVVLFASREILDWKPNQQYPIYGLVLAQWITLLLTFHFQDLRM